MKRTSTRSALLFFISIVLLLGSALELYSGTTGKIAGRVVDKQNGSPLIGANVTIVGTNLGAAVDVNGRYFILNIPPGVYAVRASVVGYSPVLQTDVRVNIDLTTTVDFAGNFALQEQAIQAGEVTIVAERPIVQPDISANVASVTALQIESLPRTDVREVIDLQAGVEPGLVIRGGNLNQLNFQVDGVSMRDGRDNQPYTAVPLTSIDEFQVQTGGFNAEYGNVRSGVVNVITKEGRRDRYHLDVVTRYQSAHHPTFDGRTAKDDDAYWIRAYKDPAVADVGTANGTWDIYTRRQFPAWEGWNATVQSAANDDDPNNNLTAAQFKQVFDYHHRKDVKIDEPNYDVDATLSGPVPFISKQLGSLRFSASYRGTQEPYFYPQARKAFKEDLAQFKITSDLSNTMKLNLLGLWSKQTGMAHQSFANVDAPSPQRGGIPFYPWSDSENSVNEEVTMLNENSDHVGRSVVFGTDRYAITDVNRLMLGASFVHTVSPSTFYEAQLSRVASEYDSHPNRRRSLAPVTSVGTYVLDEAPFGWTSDGTSSPGSGLRLGGHWARARDTSEVSVVNAKLDITSQLTDVVQGKVGVEAIFSDYNMRYRSDDSVIVHIERSHDAWDRNPFQGAAYAQTKLEFKGMIANLGLRLDYFDPRGDWVVYDPYNRSFSAAGQDNRSGLPSATPEKQLTLSPRLGMSFPISVNSKLFFNYGHFRQMLTARNLYQIAIGWNGDVRTIGDPSQPLPKTVAYELGYEHNLFDQYLLRLSGYYRDNQLQPTNINIINIDGTVNYNQDAPLNYGDVRGFELTLNKSRGNWVRGFANFTFLQFKDGSFGVREFNENVIDQRDYLRTTDDHRQNRPVSQPYSQFNVEFLTPKNFGPLVLGGHLLGDWRLDFLGQWRSGQHFTWAGPGASFSGLENNVEMRDFWSLDLRIMKNISTTFGSAQLYLDVNNILNLKYMYVDPDLPMGGPFEDNSASTIDWEQYMKSLHLDPSVFGDFKDEIPYDNIPGKDKAGDYRNNGVAFVPIEIVPASGNLPANGLPAGADFLEPGRRVLFYVRDSGQYMEFRNGAWGQADGGFVDQVIKDQAYIDNPNELDRAFLNPRSVIFGLRVSL
ncbi:MAG: TonB-dependent receptor [bacterium]